jgi:replicative DNA helicase
LIVLAGRPAMGKTALATNIAFHAANSLRRENGQVVDGGVVGFFSLEMSAEQLATRILAEQAELSSDHIRRGMISSEDWHRLVQVSRRLQDIPLFIDDTPALSIAALRTRARRLLRTDGLGLIVVDYLQLLRPGSNGLENRVQEISEITRGLKALAKELNVPVLALSQLSRQVEQREDKRPQLADLRESGSIEQDADVVMFIYREEYYHERKEPEPDTPAHAEWLQKAERVHGIAEVIIGKQRHGPTGTVKLQFDREHTRFHNLDLAHAGADASP